MFFLYQSSSSFRENSEEENFLQQIFEPKRHSLRLKSDTSDHPLNFESIYPMCLPIAVQCSICVGLRKSETASCPHSSCALCRKFCRCANNTHQISSDFSQVFRLVCNTRWQHKTYRYIMDTNLLYISARLSSRSNRNCLHGKLVRAVKGNEIVFLSARQVEIHRKRRARLPVWTPQTQSSLTSGLSFPYTWLKTQCVGTSFYWIKNLNVN